MQRDFNWDYCILSLMSLFLPLYSFRFLLVLTGFEVSHSVANWFSFIQHLYLEVNLSTCMIAKLLLPQLKQNINWRVFWDIEICVRSVIIIVFRCICSVKSSHQIQSFFTFRTYHTFCCNQHPICFPLEPKYSQESNRTGKFNPSEYRHIIHTSVGMCGT